MPQACPQADRARPASWPRLAKPAGLALVLGLLLCLPACAVERWCNELNDYSTLEADLIHCKQQAGFLGRLLPAGVNSCMESLGWRECGTPPPDRP